MRLITLQRFMHQYSISAENLQYLAKGYGIVPIQFGLQTLIDVDLVHLHLANETMHAEMKAGLHDCREKPKACR